MNLRSSPLLLLVAAVALVSFVAAEDKKPDKKDAKTEEIQLTADEQALIDLTNAERKKADKDLPPLKTNPRLMEAARKHAANMAAQEKMEHVLDEKAPADRAKAAGYKYRALGENIAKGDRRPEEVVAGWMNSEPHRENILKDAYTDIGVAVAKNDKGERYWVQVFGKR